MAVDKEHILREIHRTTAENGGKALGQGRFSKLTGIKITDWQGKYWARWNDALKEAGFSGNKMQEPYLRSQVIEQFIFLMREKGKFPGKYDVQIYARLNKGFPAYNTIFKNGVNGFASEVMAYCRNQDGYEDIINMCIDKIDILSSKEDSIRTDKSGIKGYVYLAKLEGENTYKIGATKNKARVAQLDTQLHKKLRPICYIETEHYQALEKYWHTRFKKQRKGGEWFSLSKSDIRAFKKSEIL